MIVKDLILIRLNLPTSRNSSLFAWLCYCLLAIFAAQTTTGRIKKDDEGPLLSQPLTIVWRYQSDQMTDFTPAADEQTVFFPLTSGVVVALTAGDGKLQWRAEIGGEFSAALVADDRSVYAATKYADPDQKTGHGTLRALSKTTGVTSWMRTLPAPVGGSLAADDNALFVGSLDGRIYSLDKRTGQILWSNEYGEEFAGQPLVAGGRVYFGSNAGSVRALDAKTGQVLWQYKTRGAIKGAMALKDNVLYFGSGDGNVYAFDEISARLRWQRRTGAAVQAVAAVEKGVLASSLDNFVYLLSLHKGSLVWRQQLPGRLSSKPITAADGALFTPFSTDSAIVLNLRDGKPANTLSLGEENSSAAAPISVKGLVVITIPHGLLAFGRQK